MRIYLDVSCLNRPFDDQTQSRIRLEAEAVSMVLARFRAGEWAQVCSQMSTLEVMAMPDAPRRNRVLELLPEDIIEVSPSMFARARQLVGEGLHAADAVHVAAAEALGADVFLTCDDRLLQRCRALAERLEVRVENPKKWLEEQYDADAG